MEQESQNAKNLPEDEAALAAQRLTRILDGLEAAWRTGRRIDDLTAKRIARLFDPGSGPLHEFAETGAVPPGVELELAVAQEIAQDLELEQSHIPWITALDEYFGGRLIKSEIPYWNDPSME
jgi:hypothetical protein